MPAADALRVTLEVTGILDRLGLPYLVGGSLASSLHGIPRSTLDADVAVELDAERLPPLLTALGHSFYADPERASSAVERSASFNVIHLETMFKVDLFVLPDEEYYREEMARRERYRLPSGEEITVASAEDTVLQKLLWFQLGDRVSERQWSDALGVLKVHRDQLDSEYLSRWAEELGVADLLDEALDAV